MQPPCSCTLLACQLGSFCISFRLSLLFLLLVLPIPPHRLLGSFVLVIVEIEIGESEQTASTHPSFFLHRFFPCLVQLI